MKMQTDCKEQLCYKYSCSSEQALAACVGAIQQSLMVQDVVVRVIQQVHQRVNSDRDVSTSRKKSLEQLSWVEVCVKILWKLLI